ncbi:unnamed protein product [Cuscuta epithymum]|uniref:Uncharacterized protein n=1 Tax=Cuscuta epithymum TaxID=186058 RepID=A0AAV0G0A2_9ASTE|nr:unnamed protein product [Cuscuta epithymum]
MTYPYLCGLFLKDLEPLPCFAAKVGCWALEGRPIKKLTGIDFDGPHLEASFSSSAHPLSQGTYVEQQKIAILFLTFLLTVPIHKNPIGRSLGEFVPTGETNQKKNRARWIFVLVLTVEDDT